MFGSLRKRLKKVFGDSESVEEPVKEEITEEPQETELIPQEKEEIVTEEVVDTQKGEEIIETEKIVSEEDITKITPTSIPLTQKQVKITDKGRAIREKMIEEYKEEDKELISKEPKVEETTIDVIEQEEEVPIEEVAKDLEKEVKSMEEMRPEPKVEKEVEIEDSDELIDKKTGLLKRFKKTVTEKTLSESDIEPIIDELQKALLENDVALKVAEEITEHVKKSLIESSVSRSHVSEEIKQALKKALRIVMRQTAPDIRKMIEEKEDPLVILFVGFNGVGKTTTMAKIAKKYIQYKPVFAAADTFRAASVEQVEKHGERLGVDVVKHQYGADPAAVVFDAIKHAKSIGSKLVLADSAGRTHENTNLMDELKKMVRVNNPDLNILVLDALTGNDIYEQSRKFNETIDIDAVILTKADVYSKGGAALSAAHTIGKPIMYLGTGQNYEDLIDFDPDKIADQLLS